MRVQTEVEGEPAPALSGEDAWDCPLTALQVREMLTSALIGPVTVVALAWEGGATYLQVARPARGRGPVVEVSAPVLVQEATVAVVRVTGTSTARARLATIAHLTAAHLASAWQAAWEIDSLAGEVVHAYEELHLLYELGEALMGQITVYQAATLILDKLLHVVQAAHAEIIVDDPTTPVRIHCGEDARAAGRNPQRLSATLWSNGQRVGDLVLIRSHRAVPFSSAEGKLLAAVGAFAGSAIRNAQLYQELRRQADTDALTGLANHRAIQERLGDELAQAATAGEPLAVLMIDVDDFKLFNDTYGHLVGDQILRLVSQTLSEACRCTDSVGRYGGDEFIVLLPRTDRAGASEAAHRILTLMAERSIQTSGPEPLPIALSIGIALFPDDGEDGDLLMRMADTAMYAAKRSGGGSRAYEREPTEQRVQAG